MTQLNTVCLDNKDDHRPRIGVRLGQTALTALLDSGATKSVIGARCSFLLDHPRVVKRQSRYRFVRTADRQPHVVDCELSLDVLFDSVTRSLSALYVPSLAVGLILGNDFCDEFAVKIDYLTHTCSAQVKSLPQICALGPDTGVVDTTHEARMMKVITMFGEIGGPELGRTDKLSLSIDTGNSPPFKQYQYPLSPYLQGILNKEIDEMINLGVIEPSQSPWCSPVLLVKKKSGEYRFCFDGRKLNSVTKHDSYPLPRIDRILNLLRDARWITTLDLKKAFWQIPLDEASKEKTAFAVHGRGLFQFCVMPFGLRNSAQTQQRLMDALFGPQFEPNIFVYLDDLILVTSTFEEHCRLLGEIRGRLREAKLTINVEKSKFFQTSLRYLGYVIDAEGLRTDPEKVSAMSSYPRPRNATEIKRFMGLCSWYRRFIPNFSSLVSPMNDLLKGRKKKQEVLWDDRAEKAFTAVKEALIAAPVLSPPDFSRPFTVQCDASDTGLGGVLTQVINGEEKVICFASRSLSKAERNYSVTERECLAVIFSIEKFRPYVEGSEFTVVTDHHSLLYLFRMKNPTGRLARWILRLQQFSFEIAHRKGQFHIVPDALSRSTQPQEGGRYQEPDVALIDLEPCERDQWYRRMLQRVVDHGDVYSNWDVIDGKLRKFIPSKAPLEANERQWKLVVPKSRRSEVMRSCHDPPTAAHFGVYKTLQRARSEYYWPGMRRDVGRYVKGCGPCAAQKIPRAAPFGLHGREKIARFPWQIIALDFKGPFPRSRSGHKYILVVGDWFSKYTLLLPIKRATARPVLKFLEEKVFLVFGVPQCIIVDNGKQFIGNAFKNFAKSYNVQKIWYNAKYHPQANFVEKTNDTVGTALRMYVKEHDNWDLEIPKIQCAINTSCHESTRYTPSFLNFGRHVPLSGDYYGALSADEGDEIDFTVADRRDYADNLDQLKNVFQEVRRNLHRAHVRQSLRYSTSRKDITYDVGDRVWRRNKVLSSAGQRFMAKLAPKYVLATVTAKVSNLVYRVRNEDGSDAGNWHVKDLKPFYDRTDTEDGSSSEDEERVSTSGSSD